MPCITVRLAFVTYVREPIENMHMYVQGCPLQGADVQATDVAARFE